MSTTSRRVVAAAVAAIIAGLTGIAVGLLAADRSCAGNTPVPAATTTPANAAGAGGNVAASPGNGGNVAAKPVASTAAPVDKTASCGGFAGVPAGVALAGTLVGGLAVLALLFAAAPGPRRATRAAHGPAAGRPASPAGPAARAPDADRTALIQACIYVRDRTTSKALAERLGAALHQVGVVAVEPAGARFDPARHEAGGAVPADEPAQVGTIAAVEVPGYADRGQLLRPPVVTVYQATKQTQGRDRSREDR